MLEQDPHVRFETDVGIWSAEQQHDSCYVLEC